MCLEYRLISEAFHKNACATNSNLPSLMPELVVRNECLPYAVKYHELPVLLLNELQKVADRIERLEVRLEKLAAYIEKLEAGK